MRIKHFRAQAVHGYMDFDIAFNDDLTFLTGINGSGKTTVVKGISALITPSLMSLACTDYARMEVEIHNVELEGKRRQVTISSVRGESEFVLSTSETKEDLVLPLFPSDIAGPSYRIEERELTYYSEMETEWANHPVMKLVRSLPSPMLLGIERRATALFPHLEEKRSIAYRIRRRTRSIFGSSLSSSLQDAIELAEQRYREVDARQRQLTEKLRKNILVTALKYEASTSDRVALRFHRPQIAVEDIEPRKEMVLGTLQELGLAREEFEPDLEAFFSELEEVLSLAESDGDIGQLLESGTDEERDKIFRWAVNYPQFNRITQIVGFIEGYISESREVNKPIDRYLGIVNKFLRDSNKELCFDETGALSVGISDREPVPVSSLSSGESQIIVIISHLSFNPTAQLANVFILDEPELSLHVRWQELFVKAVTEANPNLQVILATHSPSIILDDTEHCIDLSEGVL
jgi:energy-coupling factor transporter ATP-binding protein EcfA2